MEPLDLLRFIAQVLDRLNLKYAIVGSMASMYYGETRFTNDIDVVVDLSEKQISEFLSYFPADDFYVSEDAIRSAIQHRSQFNILHPESGLKCDVILPKENDLDREQLDNVREVTPIKDVLVRYARPEIVIVHKMLAYEEGGSEKHLRDIASMLKIRQEEIDRPYIMAWSQRLGLVEIWNTILAALDKPNV